MLIEAVALYWPMVLCGVMYHLLHIKKEGVEMRRVLIAALMAGAWVAATLPWLNDVCVAMGFWSFEVEHGYTLAHLPLSMYVGWILLWGVLPAFGLCFLKQSIWRVVMLLVLLDLVTMGLFDPVMRLSPVEWLWGELIVVLVSLLPAVCLAKWVICRERVAWRAGLVSAAFVMLILVVLPTSVEAVRVDLFGSWRDSSVVERCFWGILLLVVSLPGAAGVMEFARAGNGTPIPYDAPERLVTSGVYSYVKNPMQVSMVMVLVVWGWMLGSWFVGVLGVVSVIYSVGIARWSEGADLERRFGKKWLDYVGRVCDWRYGFKPVWVGEECAQIYIDGDCEVCQPLANWIMAREPVSLRVCKASEWGGERLERITYFDPNTGERREGVEAMCKVFQHVHLGWAWMGWLVMLPGINWVIQCGVDSGGGGRQVGGD